MITLFVVLVGYLVSAGFEQIYVMYSVSVYQPPIFSNLYPAFRAAAEQLRVGDGRRFVSRCHQFEFSPRR